MKTFVKWLLLLSFFALFFLGSPCFAQEEKPGKDKVEKGDPVGDTRHLIELSKKAEEEYRLFFKRPEKTIEYWAAMKFEIASGKFEIAAYLLKGLLELRPAEKVDQELVDIEEIEGLHAFYRLQTVKKWSDRPSFEQETRDNVKLLISRLRGGIEKFLSDPVRIKKYIERLEAPTPEERAFAFGQLQRMKERAVPYLIETLSVNAGKPLAQRVVEAYVKFDRDFFPPLLEIFKAASPQDAQSPALRLTLLDIFKRRVDRSCMPYLWHMSESTQYPQVVREAAKDALAYFLEVDKDRLPPAKVMLTQMAEKYFKHQVAFPPDGLRFWTWNGHGLPLRPTYIQPREAEELFGLRYAREALEIDPTYKPAQVVLLNFLLERRFDQDIHKFHLKPFPPDLQQLLVTIDSELLLGVLERALDENNLSIILPTITALGQKGDVRAAILHAGFQPRGLIRALYYPDRRVQYAALQAILRLPSSPAPVASHRVQELLGRFLAAKPATRAMILLGSPEKSPELRKLVEALGFEADVGRTLQECFVKLNKSADYDLLVLPKEVPAKELPFILKQVRADANHGRLPLLVITPLKNVPAYQKLVKGHENVWVVSDAMLQLPNELKPMLDSWIKESSGAAMTADELKRFKRQAMDYLYMMVRGDLPGHDIRANHDLIWTLLPDPDLGLGALEILGGVPGGDAQRRLGAVFLDPAFAKLKMPAALELNRHIQKNGVHLDKNQIREIQLAWQASPPGSPLRAQLAIMVGSLRPEPRLTGTRLYQFTPSAVPPPPAPAPEKEKEGN